MSEKKELNIEELEKVNGGDNEGQPTFSNKVGNINNCINDELYFTYTYAAGAGFKWFKAILLDVSYKERFGRTAEIAKIRVTDGNNSGFFTGSEIEVDTLNMEIYKNKN